MTHFILLNCQVLFIVNSINRGRLKMNIIVKFFSAHYLGKGSIRVCYIWALFYSIYDSNTSPQFRIKKKKKKKE